MKKYSELRKQWSTLTKCLDIYADLHILTTLSTQGKKKTTMKIIKIALRTYSVCTKQFP